MAITEVYYVMRDSSKHIELVRMTDVNGNKVDRDVPKDEVIRYIENLCQSVYTWVHGQCGAKVNVLCTKNEKFLRTDSNETEEDNLGELPEFTPSHALKPPHTAIQNTQSTSRS